MRVNHVQAAAKPGTCDACPDPIEKGQSYNWVKPRHGSKRSRHAACRPFRPSELTSNEKLQTLYAAQEAIEDAMAEWQEVAAGDFTTSILVDALETAAEQAREAASMYNEAADNLEHGFGHPTNQSEELQSNAADAEAWADELETAAGDLVDGDDTDEDWDEEAWRSEIVGHIEDVVGSLPL